MHLRACLSLLSALSLVPAAGAQLTPNAIATGGGRPAASIGPRAILVDGSNPNPGDGRSWATAFADLNQGLAAARPGDEVWVAQGTYTPSDLHADVSFRLPSGVTVLGGFAGREHHVGQRDWVAHPTVLSGDIGQDDVVGSGPNWYSGWNIGSPNSGHVVDASGVAPGTVLDGFVVEAGHTGPAGTFAGDLLMYGSGVFAFGGSPTIRHCTFRHNLAAFAKGGGLFVHDGDVVVEDCLFEENYAHLGGGGGLAVTGTGSASLLRCTFRYNQAVAGTVSAGDGDGAGAFLWCDGPSTLVDCTFDANVARPFYAVGSALGYGGGVFCWNGLEVVRCRFQGNRATLGGGLIVWDDAVVRESLFVGNDAVPQPNDPYPEQGGFGAGLLIESVAPATLLVEGCTIAHNDGKKHVGIETLAAGAEVVLRNSIVYGNHATHPEVIGYSPEQLSGNWSAEACCIAHVFEAPGPGEDVPDPADLPGCTQLDPTFVAPPVDLHLGAGSPCIDAGDNGLVPASTLLDLDHQPRFQDDPGAPDVGNGPAPVVDMGAFERS